MAFVAKKYKPGALNKKRLALGVKLKMYVDETDCIGSW
jgi:hypothetical protein